MIRCDDCNKELDEAGVPELIDGPWSIFLIFNDGAEEIVDLCPACTAARIRKHLRTATAVLPDQGDQNGE